MMTPVNPLRRYDRTYLLASGALTIRRPLDMRAVILYSSCSLLYKRIVLEPMALK